LQTVQPPLTEEAIDAEIYAYRLEVNSIHANRKKQKVENQ
jgi:hypothetical protein